MKKLSFLVLVTGLALTGTAQQTDFLELQLQKRIKEKSAIVKPQLPDFLLGKNFTINQPGKIINETMLSYVLSNGDKVYSLPTDNMPCVVPDMNQFSTAGVYGIEKQPLLPQQKPGNIPNVAKPPQKIYFSR